MDSTKTGHMLGSKRDFKMHVRNLGYILPYKSAIYFIARLRRRRSANGLTQTNFAKRWTALTICHRKVGVVSPKKCGAKNSHNQYLNSS